MGSYQPPPLPPVSIPKLANLVMLLSYLIHTPFYNSTFYQNFSVKLPSCRSPVSDSFLAGDITLGGCGDVLTGGLDIGAFVSVTPGIDAMFLGGLLDNGEFCICSKNFRS